MLSEILTAREPFGPRDSETLSRADAAEYDQLFDRNNGIYAQASTARPRTYLIGRKGAGKTAFLHGAAFRAGAPPQLVLSTGSVYADIAALLTKYRAHRGPVFAEHSGDIWIALFDHVAMFHACDSISADDPPNETQIVWDYFTGEPHGENATAVAARFLAELEERVVDDGVRGRDELIDGITRGGVTFAQARQALTVLLANRPVMIVMDNLEDLHVQLDDLENVLAGLFHAVGKLARGGSKRPVRPAGVPAVGAVGRDPPHLGQPREGLRRQLPHDLLDGRRAAAPRRPPLPPLHAPAPPGRARRRSTPAPRATSRCCAKPCPRR